MLRRILSLCAALWFSAAAQAAVIESAFAPLGGNTWSVDLRVLNDGAPATISGFTVYFDEARFANLSLAASPAGWDSLLLPPDLALPADGFLDAQALDASDELSLGQWGGPWVVQFDYLGGGAPGALPFDIVARDFSVLFSGLTQRPAQVAEPHQLALIGLGLLACAGTRRRRSAGAMPGA